MEKKEIVSIILSKLLNKFYFMSVINFLFFSLVVTLKIIVELLIRSHDCFTASCNMEGIASVLRKCQQLANSLQNLKHWSLLVRLVTGVGRFTEMNYIFKILKEHDQFEFLLGRGLDKVKISFLTFPYHIISSILIVLKIFIKRFRDSEWLS